MYISNVMNGGYTAQKVEITKYRCLRFYFSHASAAVVLHLTDYEWLLFNNKNLIMHNIYTNNGKITPRG